MVRSQMEAVLQTPLRASDIESSLFAATSSCVSWIDKTKDAFIDKPYTYSVVVRACGCGFCVWDVLCWYILDTHSHHAHR